LQSLRGGRLENNETKLSVFSSGAGWYVADYSNAKRRRPTAGNDSNGKGAKRKTYTEKTSAQPDQPSRQKAHQTKTNDAVTVSGRRKKKTTVAKIEVQRMKNFRSKICLVFWFVLGFAPTA